MENYKHKHQDIDLKKPIVRVNVGSMLGSGDDEASKFTVGVYRDGVQVDISDCTVKGYLIMPNAETLKFDGTVDDNKAAVTIPKEGYAYDGGFSLAIKISLEGKENTVAIFDGTIERTMSENIIHGDRVIYGVNDILNLIDSMEQAEEDAKAATASANNAAVTANNAAESANAITQTVEDKLAAGAFIGEKGDTGNTPDITIRVATGEPGTQAEVQKSGTAESPVFDITIPRGDTGAVDGIDYYNGNPSALGTASPGTANGVARGDHVHPMPTAEQVGALPENGTAKDAEQIDGKGLSEIMLGMHPVGSIYISATETSPALLFGGTWEQIKDTFLLAAGDTYEAGSKGGEESVQLTESTIPAHTHGSKSLTGSARFRAFDSGRTDNWISNTSGIAGRSASGTDYFIGNYQNETINTRYDTLTINATHEHASYGGSKAHNNMPPYLAVYTWRRVE